MIRTEVGQQIKYSGQNQDIEKNESEQNQVMIWIRSSQNQDINKIKTHVINNSGQIRS